MNRLERLFSGEVPPGVYRYRSRADGQLLCQEVEQHGWRCFTIDGRRVTDKASFLREIAGAMAFPSYFGQNWDAFEESVTDPDLAWASAPGYVVIYSYVRWFALYDPAEWSVALEILQGAVDYWRQQNTPMYVLLRHSGRALLHLPGL